MDKLFAANLRAIRLAKGITQVDLAEKLGITQPSYAKLESGDSSPNLRTICRLAEALNCDLLELLQESAKA